MTVTEVCTWSEVSAAVLGRELSVVVEGEDAKPFS